jgi:hypothetical protein
MLRSQIVVLAMLWLGLPLLAPTAQAQEPGVVGELERVASTTPQEKIQYSADALEQMRNGIKSVTKLVETARRDGDVEKLQCVTNSLTSMRALLQVSEKASVQMQEALNGNNAALADHELRKIAVAKSRSDQLLAEAERCYTQQPADGEDTIVRVEGGVEGDDDVVTDFNDLDVGIDPPEASPFM